MTLNNPFLISGYLGPEYFCDREQETVAVLEALHNERNVALIAPRRIGKTGLIQHCFHKLREENAEIVTLYMDIYSTQNLQDFVKIFAESVLGKLDTVPQKTLREVFEYLKSAEKRCYIAIDEFQQIVEYPEKGVEALLRSHIQFLPNVRFIFSGSRRHIMQEMFTSAKRPFWQSSQVLNIDIIDKDKYFEFAADFFARHGLALPREIFDTIYDNYDGVTWYLQYLLNRLYGYNQEVNSDLADYAIGQILAEYNFVFSDLLKSCAPGQARLLKAIAAERCVKEPLSAGFLTKYGLGAASSVRAALNKLTDNELVYQTDRGYIIYDRFFGDWLRRYKLS